MNLKNVSLSQVLLIALLLGATVGAHYIGGTQQSATLTSTVALIFAWFVQSPHDPTGGAGATISPDAVMATLQGLLSASAAPAPAPAPKPAPVVPAVLAAATAALGIFLAGCGAAQTTNVVDYGARLAECQQVGRNAPDGGHIAAYDACLDAGSL